MNAKVAAGGVVLLLAIAVPTLAHHAFSGEFDAQQPVQLRGTIAKVEFINPHSWFHIDVTEEDGTVTRWMIEGGTPNALFRRGVTQNTLPIGTEILVDGFSGAGQIEQSQRPGHDVPGWTKDLPVRRLRDRAAAINASLQPERTDLPCQSPGVPGYALSMFFSIALPGLIATAGAQAPGRTPGGLDEPRGIRVNTDTASPGYTLFTPLTSDTTYLIDNDGQAVRTWKSDLIASSWVYMLDDGSVIRGGTEPETFGFSGGGQGGPVREVQFRWRSRLEFLVQRRDAPSAPRCGRPSNGNLLTIAWELKTPDESRRAGRREELIPERGLWPRHAHRIGTGGP